MMGFLLLLMAPAAFYIFIYRHWDCGKKITFLSVVVYLLFGITLLTVSVTAWAVRDVRETEQMKMFAYRLQEAQDDEHWGYYDRMASELEREMNYEAEFEYLWERLIMYTGSNRYRIFAKAAEAGLGDAYEERALFYKELLESMCPDTEYESNILYGEYYLKRAGLMELQ